MVEIFSKAVVMAVVVLVLVTEPVALLALLLVGGVAVRGVGCEEGGGGVGGEGGVGGVGGVVMGTRAKQLRVWEHKRRSSKRGRDWR